MGANIGTTVTGILVSLRSLGISTYASGFAFIGVMMTFIKSEKIKTIGNILCGFGLIFVGLDIMSGALANEKIISMFTSIFSAIDFPLLLIICGMIFTALIQSSSAATGVFIMMVGSGALQMENALFLVLGSNIGTCITALIAAIGTSVNAKRTAFIHLTFNLIGTLFFTVLIWIFSTSVVKILVKIAATPEMQLAWFHLVFNVTTTALLLPFIKQLVQFVQFVIKDKKSEEESLQLRYVDDRLLKTPSVALMQVKKEVEYMLEKVRTNLTQSFGAMREKAATYTDEIVGNEAIIDFTNQALSKYLIKLSSVTTGKDEKIIGSYFHVLNDLERIGDHAENFYEIGLQMQEKELIFSENAMMELKTMQEKVLRMFEIATEAFDNVDTDHLNELTALENEVDGLKKELSARHYARLTEGACKVELSPYFSSVVAGLERVADHLVNVGFSILNPTGTESEEIQS
jgi:phosphate:Na+ symporter